MEKGKSNAVISSKLLLYIYTYLMITIEQALAYKSGCSGNYCFTVSETKSAEYKTQLDAQRWCSDNGGQLIDIQNENIQSALTTVIDPQGIFSSFRTNGARRWGSWSRLNGNDIGNITIYDGKYTTYAYGYIKPNQFKFDVYASTTDVVKAGYICSGSQLYCTNGGVSIGGQCYKSYISYLKSWYEARNLCLNEGGDLASFDSISTDAGFNFVNTSWIYPLTEYWIGFERERWIWNGTGDDVRYNRWLSGQPMPSYSNADPWDCLCVQPYNGYPWTTCRCNDPLRFICISGPTTTAISTRRRDTTFSMRSTPPLFSTSELKNTTQKHSSDVTSYVYADETKNENENDLRIPLGVGLGVGLGFIIIIVIIAVVVILFRKRGCPRNTVGNPDRKLSLSSEVTTPPSSDMHYAAVQKQQEDESMTTAVCENPTHVEYAELSLSSKQTDAGGDDERQSIDSSILMGRNATLKPPPCEKTDPNHVAINGYEYAEVTKPNRRTHELQ